MTHAILPITTTVPAYPLGQPVDGRKRYSMTASQARIYAWLREHRPHDEPFIVRFEELMDAMGILHKDGLFQQVAGLVERGWLDRVAVPGKYTRYRFVHPVMVFKVVQP